MGGKQELSGPDLANEGIPATELAEGEMILGHAGDKPVVVVRTGGEVLAVGGRCTHYGGPLGQGLFDGSTIRCPYHHACFDVRTGEAVKAPALNPVPAYPVREEDGRLLVGEPTTSTPEREPPTAAPASVVIVGGGAAGSAAAETLRREGYTGPVTLVSADDELPYDRPNVSKDYLAGEAPEEWMPVRPAQFYADNDITLRLGTAVVGLDTDAHRISLADGSTLEYGALLLATGADPIHLDLPGADRPHVHYLRTLADSRAIIAAAAPARAAVVVGASFIGLEVAASLRHRGLEVHVVAPEDVPMAPILGDDLGRFVRRLHEDHGVVFQLGRVLKEIGESTVRLDDDTTIAADLVVMGVGVRPAVGLAEAAGLDVDGGVVVDAALATSAPDVWAAGDIARWPDPRVGPVRVEHWVVAQRMGQAAARSILGRGDGFGDVPFFWSQHYDVPINYVGHGTGWDAVEVEGSIEDRDVTVGYRRDGRIVAVATVYRDRHSLEAEVAMERGDDAALDRLTGGG